jgi:hypothetical protein
MKTVRLTVMILAVAALAGGSVEAKQKTIAGDWTLSIENLPLHLVFTQKGRTLAGTLDYPHGSPFRLTGTFAAGRVTFAGDSAGQNFTVHIDATGSLTADGTLTGTINAHFVDLDDAQTVVRTRDQQIPWAAIRAPKG